MSYSSQNPHPVQYLPKSLIILRCYKSSYFFIVNPCFLMHCHIPVSCFRASCVVAFRFSVFMHPALSHSGFLFSCILRCRIQVPSFHASCVVTSGSSFHCHETDTSPPGHAAFRFFRLSCRLKPEAVPGSETLPYPRSPHKHHIV